MDIQNLQIVLEFDLSKLFSDLTKINKSLDKLEQRIERIPDVNVGANFDINQEDEQQFLRRIDALEQRAEMNLRGKPTVSDASRTSFLSDIQAIESNAQLDIGATLSMGSDERADLQRQLEQFEQTSALSITPDIGLRSTDLQSAWESVKQETSTRLQPTVRFPREKLRSSWEQATAGFNPQFDTGVSLSQTEIQTAVQSIEQQSVDIPLEFSYGTAIQSLRTTLRGLEQQQVSIPVDFDTSESGLVQLLSQRQALQQQSIDIPLEFSYGRALQSLRTTLSAVEKDGIDIPVSFDRTAGGSTSLASIRGAEENNALNIPVTFDIVQSSLIKLGALRTNLEQRPVTIPVEFDSNSEFGKALLNGTAAGDSGSGLNISLSADSAKKMSDGGGNIPNGRRDRGGQSQSRSASKRAPDHGLLTSRAGGREGGGMADRFNLRAADINNVRAKLMPALWSFTAALPAATIGIAGLAGAAVTAAAGLSAIAGLGLLGLASERSGGGMPTGEAITGIFTQIRNDLWTAFEPLAQRLAPTFERALDSADVFFMRIAQGMSVLTQMTPMAQSFGEWAMDALPMIINNMLRIATIMGDVFGQIASQVDGQAIFNGLAQALGQILPYLMQIGKTIYAALPAITNLSIGFLRVSTAIFTLLKPIIQLMNRFPKLTQMLGTAFASVMLLTSALAIANTAIIGMAARALPALGAMIISTIGSMTAATTITGALSAGLATLRTAAITAAGGVGVLRAAVVGLLATTGIGLIVALVGTLAGKWLNTKSNIDGATKSLKNFEKQQKGMGSGVGPYDAPSAPDTQTQQGPTRLGPQGGSSTTHLHGGSSNHEDMKRVADKNNFVQRRTAGQ